LWDKALTSGSNNLIELSVVIPCYNTGKALHELNERLKRTLEGLVTTYEIVYVNDSSKDNTSNLLKEIAGQDKHITAIDLMFNVGQFRALICGLEHSNGKYLITMDDDLQHPPEEIPKLYNEHKNHPEYDAVIGTYKQKRHSAFRNIGSNCMRIILGSVFNKPKDFQTTSFRCLTRVLVDTVVEHKTMFPSIGMLIFRSTSRVTGVEVEHHPRKHGSSNYSVFKLIKTFFSNTFSYTTVPLKFISALGIIISMVGFILAAYYLLKYFIYPTTIPGWTTLIILLNIYSGFMLLAIGIIGEYLIKTLQEVNKYPRYCIRAVYRLDEQ
jgi:polyisoprenyl-phosphate glycosyltransferase